MRVRDRRTGLADRLRADLDGPLVTAFCHASVNAIRLKSCSRMASGLALTRRRCSEPPSVPFKISRAVLALSIRLIDWPRIDPRTCHSCLLVVSIDVVHIHEET